MDSIRLSKFSPSGKTASPPDVLPGCMGERQSGFCSALIDGKMLRRGYTTGSCAAAAAMAAAIMLVTQAPCGSVKLKTPNGTILTLDILNAEYSQSQASCAVQKDSGDDPDVTNGVLVYAHVSFATRMHGRAVSEANDQPEGIEITGGDGIGRVTKPGLDQPVGAYAINSVPRRMIKEVCEDICSAHGYNGGLSVTISVPGGRELAARTFNPRMGIEGGISILGTSGIVEPMSEAAITETIRAELSQLYEAGFRDILLTIGNYGEAFARDKLRLSLEACVCCSNHIGETLTMAAEKGFKKALLVGHIGKLVKLGIGITNTHSHHGDGRMETLIACALTAGADLALLHKIQECVSTDAVIDCLAEENLLELTVALLGKRIEDTLKRRIAEHLEVGFICFQGMGEKAGLCVKNDLAEKMLEVFAL